MKKKISATILFGTALTLALGFVLNPINSVTVKAFTGTNELVSVDSSEAQSNNHSQQYPTTSQEARFVVFRSSATNLVGGDTNAKADIFLRDRTIGTTMRISVSSSGVQANNHSYEPRISKSGKFVVYSTDATNLIDGTTLSNGYRQVYMYSIATGVTTYVSQSTSSGMGNGSSEMPDVGNDGRFISFKSFATNLTAGSIGGTYSDVYVRDMVASTTTRLTIGDNDSYYPRVDCGGRFVTFSSLATNLVSGDTNGQVDVFLADTMNGATLTNITIDGSGGAGSSWSSISCNGEYIVFDSSNTNLVAGDTNGQADVFRYDRLTGSILRASLSSGGGEGNNSAGYSDVSGDGRFIVFQSAATNLVASDTNAKDDSFLRDMTDGTTELVAGTSGGSQANGVVWSPAISADGKYVVYFSDATNLTTDTNAKNDIFVSTTGEEACTF